MYDTEEEELSIIHEPASTHTPEFVYLFRLRCDYLSPVNEEKLLQELERVERELIEKI